jgi:hypothetical protein
LAEEDPAGTFLLPEVVGDGGAFLDEEAEGFGAEAEGLF